MRRWLVVAMAIALIAQAWTIHVERQHWSTLVGALERQVDELQHMVADRHTPRASDSTVAKRPGP